MKRFILLSIAAVLTISITGCATKLDGARSNKNAPWKEAYAQVVRAAAADSPQVRFDLIDLSKERGAGTGGGRTRIWGRDIHMA